MTNTREIKFRAWDKTRNKMTGGCCNLMLTMNGIKMWQFGFSAPETVNQDDFILMQYTGLKDKNGVEIYEGDIVNVLGDICRIRWSQILCRIVADKSLEGRLIESYYFFNEETVTDIEVIGNIYENPELLEVK